MHGIDAYFAERARCARRVALLSLALSVGALVLLWAARTPTIRDMTNRARWGYEGPNEYVVRITLKQESGTAETEAVTQAVPTIAFKGGTTAGQTSRLPNARPQTLPRLDGAGDSDADLITRAVTRMANVPVIRSEELVIDHLVRPSYPETMLDNNIEGTVTLQALVDTVGTVVEVQVVASTGQPPFESAATLAVWQCRFRPYQVAGQVREVYALFRFDFNIY